MIVDIPVAVTAFNRPDHLEQVFQVLRVVAPTKLYLVADGPRAHVDGEDEKCAQVREIFRSVDWDCDVTEIFSEENLGCARRMSSGITEVFKNEERAIILEDDCIPHPSFFKFCKEMLDQYENDERVMHISGDNFQFGAMTSAYSYYFSRYTHCWGWATWRRAWDKFSLEMPYWQELKADGWLHHLLDDPTEVRYWTQIFDAVVAGKVDSWAYPWTYSTWLHSGLSILPNRNLVSNIGFDGDGTHTNIASSPQANMPTYAMSFPLEHPPHMIRNFCADSHFSRLLHSMPRRYVW